MSSLFGGLLENYVRQAWVFSCLHLLFFLYFFYRWRQNWMQVGAMLRALADDARDSDLLKYAADQIRRYSDQGREPDLPRIERYIAGRFDRGPETIRPLVNTFVIIGLMGTLFSLFTLGQQAQQVTDSKQILGRMGIAFGASFFGILWALICSVLFLTPLRRRTNRAVQEVGRRLTELSAEHPPRSPERALEQLAQTLRENVSAMGKIIAEMSAREVAHMNSTRAVMTEFSAATRVTLESLATKVDASQARTERTAVDLKEAVTSSLDNLKERFVEISQSWREELKHTIESSEKAAARLGLSSEHLTVATKDVAGSLQAVRDSLERTKDLARIVEEVERLTRDYLKQTSAQMEAFEKGVDTTLDAARAIPDEWFTMLRLAGDRLASEWSEITAGWRSHVTDTGDHLATRLGLINDGLTPVSNMLAPDGRLVAALDGLHDLLIDLKGLLDAQARAELAATATVAATTEETHTVPAPPVDIPAVQDHGVPNGLGQLTVRVEDIHSMLGDFFSRFDSSAGLVSVPTQELTELAAPVEQDPRSDLPSIEPLLEAISALANDITLKLDELLGALIKETTGPVQENVDNSPPVEGSAQDEAADKGAQGDSSETVPEKRAWWRRIIPRRKKQADKRN